LRLSHTNIATILAIWFLLVGATLSFLFFEVPSSSFYLSLGITNVAAILTFFLIQWLIGKFIQARINIIYRTILDLKFKKKQRVEMEFGEDIIDTVSREVLDWEKSKTEEIFKLRELESYRKEFIGNIAHELKTPAFTIQGYIYTLLEGGLEDENINKKYLERTANSVERMLKLLEDLDTISKLESNRLDLNITSFNISELIKDVCSSLELIAEERNVKFVIKENQLKNTDVMADKDKIGQVIMNLINNAINYSKPEGGEVEIRLFDMEKNILIEIADSGIGISKEHFSRLFERFYRVDKSRSRNSGGTGLGLAIVKHIIETHQQTINVRSTVGIGSTFSFTLKKA
jgi:two-component system phosphate regulon sensor histidine kinase PhoR